MAWGCFCWIPCPYKKWNDDDRPAMIAMLPLVGTGLGLVTAIVWLLIAVLGGSPILSGAVVTAAYFVMTGFIHLDGFMDVADAVMPRHPDLEVRRRILKDPHTGSFAAVSMALMFLVFAASMAAMSALPAAGAFAFIAVATVSRCMSAVSVLSFRPMETSQYVTTDFGKSRQVGQVIAALVITAIVLAGCALACLYGAHLFDFVPGTLKYIAHEMGRSAALGVLASAGVCAATALIIGALDRKSLGGMNGDISGHMITSGEMAGVLAAAILIG